MKTFRALWVTVFNLVLTVLPLVFLVGVLVYYGQPLLNFYRDYFLGSPVEEIQRLTVNLAERPGQPLPFLRLRRQYSSLDAMQTISDTERQRIRESTVRLHQAVIARLETGDATPAARTIGDSYAQFLDQDVLGKVFNRPDLMRERLLRDFWRTRELTLLPYHPARGLDAFLSSSDTAVDVVVAYGDIYADQVTCRQIFKVDCEAVYRGSVDLAANRVGQYFTGWPHFARTLPSRLPELNDRMGGLLEVYNRIQRRLEGYLRSPPWDTRPGFREAYDSFRDRFVSNLRSWYREALEGVQIGSRQFGEETWEARREELKQLKRLEEIVQSGPTDRDFLFTDQIRSMRTKLVRDLRETYRWVQVNRTFDTGFRVSEPDVQLLASTLRAFPEGEEFIQQDRELIERLRTAYGGLRDALEQQNYAGLTRRLANLKQHLSEEKPVVWKIMLERFLLTSRDRITRPDWQPETRQGQEEYERLVRLYGELGNRLNLAEFDSEWVDTTLVAMKSRRFNQISYDLRKHLSNLTSENRSDVRGMLQELVGLEDLADPLQKRATTVVFRAVLLERIALSDDTLYQAFRSRFQDDQTRLEHWQRLSDLLGTVEGRESSELVKSVELPDYVDRYRDWVTGVDSDGPLGRMVQQEAAERLSDVFSRLGEWVKARVLQPPHDHEETKRLLGHMPEITAAARGGRNLPGFTLALDLQRWQNALKLRDCLLSVEDAVSKLTKGELLGSNEAFQSYSGPLRTFEFAPLPEDYNPMVEVELMSSIHERVIERAKAVHESASKDWLSGWGGRVTGTDILSVWEDFLRELTKNAHKPELAETARELHQNSREVRRSW